MFRDFLGAEIFWWTYGLKGFCKIFRVVVKEWVMKGIPFSIEGMWKDYIFSHNSISVNMEGFRPGLILPVRNLSPGSSLMHDRGMKGTEYTTEVAIQFFLILRKVSSEILIIRTKIMTTGRTQLSNCEQRPVISRTSCLGKTSKIEARRKRSSSIEEKKIKKKKARRRN